LGDPSALVAMGNKATFCALPFITILAAMMISQSINLFFDSVSTTPLASFRACLMAGLFGVAGPPSKCLCAFVDAGLLLFLELFPLFRSQVCRLGWWSGYVMGLVEGAFFLSVLFIIADFLIELRGCGPGKGNKAREIAKELQGIIELHGMAVSICTRSGLIYNHRVFQLKMVPGRLIEDGIPKRWSFSGPLCIFFGGIWIFVCVGVSCAGARRFLDPIVAAFLMFTCVLVFSFSLARMLNVQAMGTTFGTVVAFLALLSMVLMSGAGWHSEPQDKWALMELSNATAGGPHDLNTSWINDPGVQPYPLCKMRWGSAEASLSPIDMASLAWNSYEKTCFANESGTSEALSIETFLRKSFGTGPLSPKLIQCDPNLNHVPRYITVRFASKSGQKDTWVVAVKGTSTKLDAFTDTDVYGTVKVLQFIDSLVLPVLRFVPISLTRWFLTWTSFQGTKWKQYKQQMWGNIIDHVRDLQAHTMNPGDTVVLTGHSLGGGLASVAASHLGIDSLVFSAPGTHFLQVFFDLDPQPTQKSVNVIPDHDLVPRVDITDGVSQPILCKDRQGVDENPGICHEVMKSTCELWRVCGDAPMHRNFTRSCTPFIDPKWIGRNFPTKPSGRWAGFLL